MYKGPAIPIHDTAQVLGKQTTMVGYVMHKQAK